MGRGSIRGDTGLLPPRGLGLGATLARYLDQVVPGATGLAFTARYISTSNGVVMLFEEDCTTVATVCLSEQKQTLITKSPLDQTRK